MDAVDGTVFTLDGRGNVMKDKYGLEFPWFVKIIIIITNLLLLLLYYYYIFTLWLYSISYIVINYMNIKFKVRITCNTNNNLNIL